MKDFIELITSFFGEYFSYSLNALTLKEIWFKPSEITVENQNKKLTLNPKQIIFTIFNLLIGLSIINTIKEVEFSEIAPSLVMAIILWLLWSLLNYLICYLLQLRALTLLNSFALSLQTFGIIYILASLLTVFCKTMLPFYDSGIIFILFMKIQFGLLLIFLSIAFIKHYQYKFKVQPIVAATLCSITYFFINYQIVRGSENDSMTYAPPPKEEFLVLDAHSILPGNTAASIISEDVYKNFGSIIILSDTIYQIDTRDGRKTVDSFLLAIKHGNMPNDKSIFRLSNELDRVSNLYLYSNFEWASDDYKAFLYCDTLFANYVYYDSSKNQDGILLKNSIDSSLTERYFHHDAMILIPRFVRQNNSQKKFQH